MGSNETATATIGGPRVIDVFDGNGAPSGPNYLLFSDADRLPDSLRDRSGVGWSPTLHARELGALQRALDRNLWQIMVQCTGTPRTLGDVSYSGSGGVGDCPRLIPTLGDPWETAGPRIDKIPLARPPWWRRQYRDIEKLFFLGPSKCPIGLFGPGANRTILEQLQFAFEFAC